VRLRAFTTLTTTVALAATVATASSIIPPRDLGDLAARSAVVVYGEALHSRVVHRGQRLYTATTFEISEVVKGRAGLLGPLTVMVPGGELADSGWLVAGAPRFADGERYLLMLSGAEATEMQLEMLSYGVFREVRGRDGSALLEPVAESRELQAYPRPDGVTVEPLATYRAAELLRHLGDVTRGATAWNRAAAVAAPEQVPFTLSAAAPPGQCVFMTASPPYTRWRAFDPGQSGSVSIYSDSGGDPSIGGGGHAQVQSAIAMWNGTSSSINIVYGGTADPGTGFCDGTPNEIPGQNADRPLGANTVIFDDPCDDIPDLSGCSGWLGFGGPIYSGTHPFDGTSWRTVIGWDVILNDGVGCLGSTNYSRMVAHEMGHGLGFGHVSDSGALMYQSCCHDINATDATCAAYTYPVPSTDPPATPTGVAATDGTSTDWVRVTWSAASGATSYRVYRDTDSNSSGASQIGTPSGTSFDDTTATQGTTYWYWVVATNSNGDSGFSASDTGYRATCPGAPPAPAATATAVAGSGQNYVVDWTDTSPDPWYEIQEDDNAGFTSPTSFTGSSSSRTFNHAVDSPTTFHYRVRARDNCSSVDSWSGWSAPVSTEVVPCGTPAAPTASVPAAADSGVSYQLTWSPTSPDNSYDVQEATNASFTGASTWTVTGTSRAFSHVVGGATTYYYRVRARDACGGTTYTSTWSAADWIVVSPCTTPAAPVVTSLPASVPTGQAYTVSWGATSPDPAYELQEATDAAFAGATTLAQTDTSEMFVKSPGANTTFYYRVRALNACGGSTYSSLWSNTASTTVTVCTAPGAPSLVAPSAGAKVAGPTVNLSWGAVAGATSYDVYFGQGDPPLASNVTGTAVGVSVTEGQAYSWKVVAKNSCGQGASAVRSFTVCSAPAPPVANFTWSPQGAAPGFPSQQQPYVGQTVQLTDQSTNSPTQWSWYDFQGVGISYSTQNPTHAWSEPGSKNVRMSASNCQGSSGELLKTVTVYADVRQVTADFGTSPTAVQRDVVTTFTAMQGYSYGDPTEFAWTFKDNNAGAAGAVVTHTFACGGSFDVVLTAKRGSYQQTITRTIAVGGASCCAAPAKPVAAFTWSPQGVDPDFPEQSRPIAGEPMQLTDQSSNAPTSWAWTGLPEGSDATAQHPTVVWPAPGTFTVGLTATNCKGASTTVFRQIVVSRDIRPVDERFDFGTATSPLEPGYTRVVHTTAYSQGAGFGWASGALDSRNRSSGTALSRDLVFGVDATFAVDVPNGIYDVALTSGDQASAHDEAGVFLEGVQVDTLTTAKNQWVTRVHQVAVADGQLTVTLRDLGGADKFFVVNALTVATAPTRRFDFGIPGSPVAAGFVPVAHSLRYTAGRGFGWLTGTVGGRDRGTGSDLARDINFSALATFAVDLPDGQYDVTVRLGDMGAGHDQAGVFLEGALAASTTTLAGQVEVRTVRTTVADGQLTVVLDDLGGSDANVAIAGLEVAEVAPPQIRIYLPGHASMALSRVPAGSFTMGSPESERGRLAEEGPQHQVTLTRAYYIGVSEVTQAQWQAVMGSNPSSGAGVGPDLPVYNVTWNQVAGPGGFLEKLNQHLAATAQAGAGALRLPSEAEWERAARGGAATRFAFGEAAGCGDGCGDCLEAEETMWFCGNAGSTNHVAAALEPNALGLFDAHGNVWEWVADRWGAYPSAAQVDPAGPASGAYRVVRGGDSFGGVADCRAARREYQAPASSAGNIGLRVARTE